MGNADKERDFWETKAAAGVYVAIEAIGPDPSMWDGAQLESDLQRILRAIDLNKNDSTRILDLGCGIGRVAIPLAQRLAVRSDRPWDVIGVDISDSMLRYAAARDRALPNPSVYDWVLCDGRTLPRYGPLALTYSLLTLQHIPRDAAADYIRQIGEQTPLGGALLFQTLEGTGGDFLWNEMTEDFATEICGAAGFEVVEFERVKSNTADNVTAIWVTGVRT